MSDDNNSGTRRSRLGLHELGEDLQDLGQVTVNVVGDLLQVASALITLPFQLLPGETRGHLKNAAREAGLLAQSLAEGVVNTANEGVQQLNRSMRWSVDSSSVEADNNIVIEDDTSDDDDIEDETIILGSDAETTTDATEAAAADRQAIDPDLQGLSISCWFYFDKASPT